MNGHSHAAIAYKVFALSNVKRMAPYYTTASLHRDCEDAPLQSPQLIKAPLCFSLRIKSTVHLELMRCEAHQEDNGAGLLPAGRLRRHRHAQKDVQIKRANFEGGFVTNPIGFTLNHVARWNIFYTITNRGTHGTFQSLRVEAIIWREPEEEEVEEGV